MGKSNKFDFSNRSNSGAKMGKIIGNALEKEADKLRKDVEKQATKSRKDSDGSVNGKDHLVHPLDIKAPGKELGDEGACALLSGLHAALQKGDNLASLILEDLNLSDNCITTESLVQLAPIVRLAKHDLKTLNLAKNNIKVETSEEAQQWELFLESFQGTFKMRRLDLSGNTQLGAKALEILFRVHLREDPINPLAPDGESSVHTLAATMSDNDDDDEDNQKTPTHAGDLRGDDAWDSTMSRARFIKRRCGLRSIPYITLQNINLTDGGALWLSYILEDHYYPSQLVDELNAIDPDSTIKAYQQDSKTNGVEWDEHEPDLGKDGLHLLKQTERFRLHLLVDDRSTLTESTESLDTSGPVTDRDVARAMACYRRASFRSIRTNDGGEHETSERESIRKKIQRAIIAQHRAASVDLWRAALKTVVAYRILVFSRPPFRRQYIGPPKFNFKPKKTGTKRANERANPSTPTKSSGTYASTLLVENPNVTPGEPELAITEVTNTPCTPKMLSRPPRKGGFSEGSDDLEQVSTKLEGFVLSRGNDPQRFIRWQEAHPTEGYRNTSIPSHLPRTVIDLIVDQLLSEEERASLTAEQRGRAYAWASDRGTFEAEKEWRKMADSAQVWTLLESIGCLNYEKV